MADIQNCLFIKYKDFHEKTKIGMTRLQRLYLLFSHKNVEFQTSRSTR